MKVLRNIDLYDIGDKFVIAEKDNLYLLEDNKIKDLKLPLNIKDLQLSVGVDNKLAVWGDDGIGNTFYIGNIETGEWERIWLTDTKKKVASVVLDYKDNIFVVLRDDTGIVYEALIERKRYIWTPPRNTPASISLSSKSNAKNTFLQIEQSDNAPIQVTKELKQTCKINFVIEAEYKGVENEAIKFNHIISEVSIEAQNFETVKLTPTQFKALLSGDKVLQEIVELKYKTISYASYRVERDTPPVFDNSLPDDGLLENDTIGREENDKLSGLGIVRVSPNIPPQSNKPVYKG